MNAEQMFGLVLKATSAVTALCPAGRIYHGLRPSGTGLPCINFYRIAGGLRQRGMETVTFSVNCRATTAQTALKLARAVVDLWHGTSSTGVYGLQDTFGIARASLRNDQGLIPEPEDDLFNAPIDVQVVYPTGSVT